MTASLFPGCISTIICDVAQKAEIILDCVRGKGKTVKTIVLMEAFDSELVSRGQDCGVEIISLADFEVRKGCWAVSIKLSLVLVDKTVSIIWTTQNVCRLDCETNLTGQAAKTNSHAIPLLIRRLILLNLASSQLPVAYLPKATSVKCSDFSLWYWRLFWDLGD